MEQLKVKAHIGQDGMLNLSVPVGKNNIDCDITITFQTPFSQEEWLRFIFATAGSLANDPIERLPQGELDLRDPIA